MKMSKFASVLAALLLITFSTPASPKELTAGNCSSEGSCEGDESPCPPDSAPEGGEQGAACACKPGACREPLCMISLHMKLVRRGSAKPGDCCDVYECVQPRERNCSGVVCPAEAGCPPDSYRLPSHRAPHDCCSVSQGCQCLPGVCQRVEATCPPGRRQRVVRPGTGKPGSCCPLLDCVEPESNETCSVYGKIMKNGSTWWNDSCTECRCSNGLTFCSLSPPCPELDKGCTPKAIPGECCPVCESFSAPTCMSDGKIMQSGDQWQMDPCTTCTCKDGVKQCQSYMCEACFNPVYVEGECCPVCNGSNVVMLPSHCPAFNDCPLRCMHGFKRDQDGCFSCQCQREQCLLDCPGGYAQDVHGNKLCECAAVAAAVVPADCPPLTGCRKTCPHGFRLNKVGCEVCKCSQCKPFTCDKNCSHGYKNNDRGCPICKCQAASQAKHESVSSTALHGGGDLICISSDHQTHGDGEDWFDGCRQCYCHGGIEMCNIITCPPTKCKNPIFLHKTDCCPSCPGSQVSTSLEVVREMMLCQSVDGSYRVEGETWQLSPCTQCLCHSGRVLCEARQCPPTPCESPVLSPQQCCPHCFMAKLAEEGAPCEKSHLHGSLWREGNCRSCVCNSGKVECFDDKCPDIVCDHPVMVKNSCCPLCLDTRKPKVCEVGNITYNEEEKWNEDACTQCSCQNGVKVCTEKVCSVSCSNPVKKPGKCCPVCKAEESSSLGFFRETTYLVTICILFVISVVLVLYIGRWQCRRRRQMDLEDMASPHSYNNYSTHTPPPHYTCADRRDTYQYKYSQPYDASHIDGLIKSPEKMALAPV